MYNIAICEDNIEDRQRIHDYFESFFAREPGQYVLEDFSSGEQFFAQTKAYQFQMVIFDIELYKMNGISAANKLRGLDRLVSIVFTTSHPEYVFSSFSAEPLQYLLKPVNEKKFREIITKFIEKTEIEKSKKFILTFNNEIFNIPISEIIYFESTKRVVEAVTVKGRYPFYDKLNEIEKMPILKDFIRCHQSFLVNSDYISRITSDSVRLTDGTSIVLSRSRAKIVKDSYMFYIENINL